MSEPDRISNIFHGRFRPASHYQSPDDVLRDARLTTDERRVILSSWASDMYAVESNPALRDIPGIRRPMQLNDILGALRKLDGEDDPPPRGAAAMRPVRFSSLEAVARTRRRPIGRWQYATDQRKPVAAAAR